MVTVLSSGAVVRSAHAFAANVSARNDKNPPPKRRARCLTVFFSTFRRCTIGLQCDRDHVTASVTSSLTARNTPCRVPGIESFTHQFHSRPRRRYLRKDTTVTGLGSMTWSTLLHHP